MRTFETKSGYKIIQILGGKCNVFLLTNGSVNILIDSSTNGYWRKLDLRLKALKITQIDYLILAHLHYDHSAC